MPPLDGLAARLLELGEQLRAEGVAVGTSELLDAFAVLREIPWTSQDDFREALAATLAKSQDDRRVFELVFDRFFFRAVELASVREGVEEGDPSAAADLSELSETELDALRRQIAAAAARRRGGRDARSCPHGHRHVRPAGAGLGGDRRGRATHSPLARPTC